MSVPLRRPDDSPFPVPYLSMEIYQKPNYIMIKNLSRFLLPLAVALTGCSQSADEPSAPGQGGGDASKQKVEMTLSRATAEELQAAGISKFTVFIYKVNRREYTLVEQKECDATQGRFTVEFPLGETYQTFAVANADNFTGTESYETVTVNIDPTAKQDVWVSTPQRFSSDKSFSTLDVALRRVIAAVDFQTAETAADLAAAGNFDRLDVTFNDIAASYKVSDGTVEGTALTLQLDASTEFKGSFTTFPTTSLENNATITIDYLKGGEKVNTSSSPLETMLKYEAAKHYTFTVPVSQDDYVQTPWRTASLVPAGARMKVTVDVTPF